MSLFAVDIDVKTATDKEKRFKVVEYIDNIENQHVFENNEMSKKSLNILNISALLNYYGRYLSA
jgi:hypothetical protein